MGGETVKKSGESSDKILGYLAEYWWHMDVKKILEAEEEPSKRVRGKSGWHSHRAAVVPTGRTRKPHNL